MMDQPRELSNVKLAYFSEKERKHFFKERWRNIMRWLYCHQQKLTSAKFTVNKIYSRTCFLPVQVLSSCQQIYYIYTYLMAMWCMMLIRDLFFCVVMQYLIGIYGEKNFYSQRFIPSLFCFAFFNVTFMVGITMVAPPSETHVGDLGGKEQSCLQ